MNSSQAPLLLSFLVVCSLLLLGSCVVEADPTYFFHAVSASDTDGGGGADGVAMAGEGLRPRSADGELPSIAGAADAADHHHAYDPAVAHSDEEKLGNHELNREHAKNTRLRKKAYVERRKISVEPGGSGADAGDAPRVGIEGVDIPAKSGPTTDLHELDGDIIPMKTDENGMGIEDSHNRDDVPMIEVSVEEPVLSLSSSNKFGNENISIYEGIWGWWKPWVKNQAGGWYACGAQLSVEGHQGPEDDTAANGLQLIYCSLTNWNRQNMQQIWRGSWGYWRGVKMCSYGKYIGAASVRFEDQQGSEDDTALNGLKIYCVDENWSDGEVVMVHAGFWGSWKPWGYKWNKLVKGARVKSEDSQGDGDDTAMNGIQFNVEKPNYSISRQSSSVEEDEDEDEDASLIAMLS